MAHTIVGFFDDKIQADQARARLTDVGYKESDISVFSSGTDDITSRSKKTSSAGRTFGERIKHFFSHLGEDYSDSDEAQIYAEGIRRGGYTLSVITEEGAEDRVADILNEAGAVDIDKRGQYYKESGYTEFDINAAPLTPKESAEHRRQYMDWEKNQFDNADLHKEEVIPVVEEKVNISKRPVEKGRVRLFTRVTETPVNQELHLHNERVEVERRPVDRPVQASDMSAFKEGEMEFTETSEEAVVNKEARVIEEVRVKKQSEDLTEAVHETARRTDIEIDRSGPNDKLKTNLSKDELQNRR